MNIRMKTMLGSSMSWAVVMRNLAIEMEKDNSLFLESINGYDMVSENLLSRVMPCFNSDLDITYTMPQNFEKRFHSKSKIKAAIYNYESSLLPIAWRNSHVFVDRIFPSSNYCKDVFVNSGFPIDKVFVIPHGINHSEFSGDKKTEDIKDGVFNFLNVSIPHYRKNLDKLIEAYYLEFSDSEGVCLNIKTSISSPKKYFEINVLDVLQNIGSKFKKKLPPVKILTKRYDSMYELYNSSDCLVSTTSSEGFGLPILEAMASKLLVVCPNQTGQSDFLNDENSIDICGKYIESPKEYQYWRPSIGSEVFMPDVDSIRSSMRAAYSGSFNDKKNNAYETSLKYTWNYAYKKIMESL